MNETLDIIFSRTSLRRYDEKPISDEDLDYIKSAIIKAPTAGNMAMYSVLVIKDEDKKKTLSKTCDNQEFIGKAPVVMIFLADMNKIYKYMDCCDVEDYAKKHDIDYVKGDMASLFLSISDTMIAAQNAVIAGESLNIGSCYIGDIMENYETHRTLLNLPDNVFPIGMLTLGYYPQGYKRVYRPRFDDKYIFFEESYKDLVKEDYEDMYSDKEKLVNEDVHGVKNFGQLLFKKKFGNEFFGEMNRSIEEILKHWRKGDK